MTQPLRAPVSPTHGMANLVRVLIGGARKIKRRHTDDTTSKFFFGKQNAACKDEY